MSSKGTTIITPDVATPAQDVQVYADGATHALLVKVVNPSGPGGGGGTEYAEDSAHTTGDFGTLSLVVRKDTPGTLVSADGDYAPLQVDASGALRVVVVSGGGGGGGTQYAEDAAHTSGDTGTLALVVRNDTPGALAGTDGDYAVLQVDATGRLRVAVDAAVSLAINNFPTVQPVNDNGGSLTVDGTVAATQSGSWTVTATDGGGSLTVDGSVAVSNFPAVYPVNDNGGSLTVDGTVAATQSGTWSVTATQATHANLNATVRVQDRDSAGLLSVLPADDLAVFPMTETGVLPLFLVTDSPAASAGNFTYGRMNEAGALYVTLLNDFSKLESTAHASGDGGVPAWAVRNDASTALAVNGAYHPLMVGSTGRLLVDAALSSAPNSIIESGDGSGKLLDIYEGTEFAAARPRGPVCLYEVTAGASGLSTSTWTHPYIHTDDGGVLVHMANALSSERAEDAAHSSGHVGQFVLAVRQDTIASSVSADGDYAALKVNASGALYVHVVNSSSGGGGGVPTSLADGQLANALGVLYTVPVSTSVTVTSFDVYNTGDTVQTVRIHLQQSGGTSRQVRQYTLGPGESASIVEGDPWNLEAGDEIEGFTTTATTVNFFITGTTQ